MYLPNGQKTNNFAVTIFVPVFTLCLETIMGDIDNRYERSMMKDSKKDAERLYSPNHGDTEPSLREYF